MAIAFVSHPGLGDRKVVNYRGAVTHAKATANHGEIYPHLTRYEVGVQPISMIPEDRSNDQACLIQLLMGIPEFQETDQAVIEMQLAANKSSMSRLEGICYGWLQGAHPHILTTLNGSTCRKKAISDFFEKNGIDIDTIQIQSVAKKHESKIPSYKFVKVFHPQSWQFFQENGIKLDDVCDTLVYAEIAYAHAHPIISSRSKKKPPKAGFNKPILLTSKENIDKR